MKQKQKSNIQEGKKATGTQREKKRKKEDLGFCFQKPDLAI